MLLWGKQAALDSPGSDRSRKILSARINELFFKKHTFFNVLPSSLNDVLDVLCAAD